MSAKANDEVQFTLEHLINVIVLSAGIILILLSMLCEKGGQWETILISIGSSLIASAIVSFLTSIYILKYQRAKDIAETWGIRSIEEQRAFMNVQKDKDEGKNEGSTAQSITKLVEWAAQLNTGSTGKIELRFCETLPSELYYRVDKYIYTGPYQFGRESQRSITTEYKSPGKGYSYYKQYFEDLWNDENFCS